MLDSMYVTMSISSGLYPNLDLWNANKLQLQLLRTAPISTLVPPFSFKQCDQPDFPNIANLILPVQPTLVSQQWQTTVLARAWNSAW